MKTPVILRVFKNSQLVEVKQFDQDQIVVGHEAEVHLDLDHESVSPIHCLFERRDQTFYICDLGSKSGTFKNGQAVLDEALASGDEIQIGPFKLSFFVGAPKPRSAPNIPASPPPPVPTIPAAKPEAKAEVKAEVKASSVEVVAKNVAKPEIKAPTPTRSYSKKPKTFAPGNQIADLTTFFQSTKGNAVEVSVAWKGRVVDSYHFRKGGLIKAKDLNIPRGVVSRGLTLIEIRSGVKVYVAPEMEFEIISKNQKLSLEHALAQNKVTRSASGFIARLEQSEVIHLTLPGGNLQLIIRHVPLTPIIPLMPPLLMSSEEVTGLILSLVLVALLGFTISATSTSQEPPKEEEITRVAQVVFNNPPKKPPTQPEVKPPPPIPPPPEKKPPPPPPVKIKAAEKTVEAQKKGKSTTQKPQQTQVAKKASEVAPIPNSQNKPKKFTSVKQGGAVKIGQKAGSNAQSAKDVTKMGLFSAFGGGGIRKKIDETYSGAGEMLGNADKANGLSGMDSDRSGDDLGSKVRDTGAGGKGTATQGISGIGTKGRNGTSGYGSTEGFGDKTSVNIESGGAEESFEGTIDREAVRRVVQHNLNQVRGCFVRELNKLDLAGRNKLEGKVIITWDIMAKGIPKNVRVKSSTLNNKTVENCIRDRLATWSFPEPPVGMTAEVSYPFLLRPGN